MRTILKIGLLITIAINACFNSQNKNFYDVALIKAEKEQKLLILDFGAIWCRGCTAYDKYVFQDSSTIEKIEDKFIILKIDKDNPDHNFLVEKFRIQGLPHIVIINAKEQILGSLEGFDARYVDNPGLFISKLEHIINTQDEIKKLEIDYHSDTTDVNTVIDLLQAYKSVGQNFGIKKMKDLLVTLDPTPERLFEHNYNQAIYSIKEELNPIPLLSLLRENLLLDDRHILIANENLLYITDIWVTCQPKIITIPN